MIFRRTAYSWSSFLPRILDIYSRIFNYGFSDLSGAIIISIPGSWEQGGKTFEYQICSLVVIPSLLQTLLCKLHTSSLHFFSCLCPITYGSPVYMKKESPEAVFGESWFPVSFRVGKCHLYILTIMPMRQEILAWNIFPCGAKYCDREGPRSSRETTPI